MFPKPKSVLLPNTSAFESEPMVKATGFREYDARWLFNKEINLMGVQALGMGLGALIAELGVKQEIVTGHDFRGYSASIKYALISGLIPRRFTGEEKSRRQVLFSTDLVYDVLRKHQADHVLLRAARADAATGLLDLRRLGGMLARIQGRITHRAVAESLGATFVLPEKAVESKIA